MKKILICAILLNFLLFSCVANPSNNNSSSSSEDVNQSSTNPSSSSAPVESFTVTWKNDDGTILETDSLVPTGVLPTYNGTTPSKPSQNNKIYIFSGWSPEITNVKEDIVYTATFNEITNEGLIEGINPVVSSDGKSIKYGYYPQSNVDNPNLISTLSSLTPSTNNWVVYEDNFYTKVTANVFNSENYSFDNSSSITNGSTYWFKCEPIEWNILNVTEGVYFLVSSKLLDTCVYYTDYSTRTIGDNLIYSNNYKESSIRTYLNTYFFNTAFFLNNSYIQETQVNNSSSTSDASNNIYCCENTTDKVYLPSYADYLNSSLGFEGENKVSSSRQSKTTDYCRVKGAWLNKDANYKNNSSYWTRTPTSTYEYCAWNVNSAGYLSSYAVDGASHCIRPCITISL